MDVVIRDIERPTGLPPLIGHFVVALSFGRDRTRKVLTDLSPAEVAERLPGMHSIGALSLHLGEAEYFWISSIAMEREMTDEGKRMSHYCDTMENDVDRGFTAEYCIDTIDRISADTRQWLTSLTDDDLSRFHPRSDVSPHQKISLAHILQGLVDHEAHHRGQIAMIKRMLRERNV